MIDAREQAAGRDPGHASAGWTLAGVSTAVLEGGDGPPLVLLHGPGEFAAKWMRVIPDLVTTPSRGRPRPARPRRLGASATARSTPIASLDWLDELIERTCPSPPVLVGHVLGGAIAARFAVDQGDRLRPARARGRAGPRAASGRRRGSRSPCSASWRGRASAPTTASCGSARSTWTACASRWASAGSRSSPTTSSWPARRARRPPGRLLRELGMPRIPHGRPRADRRSHDPDLGPPRPRDPAADRRGRERPLRLAAARDRGLRRRPPARAARGVPASAALRDRKADRMTSFAIEATADALRRAPARPAARARRTRASRRRRASGTA